MFSWIFGGVGNITHQKEVFGTVIYSVPGGNFWLPLITLLVIYTSSSGQALAVYGCQAEMIWALGSISVA